MSYAISSFLLPFPFLLPYPLERGSWGVKKGEIARNGHLTTRLRELAGILRAFPMVLPWGCGRISIVISPLISRLFSLHSPPGPLIKGRKGGE